MACYIGKVELTKEKADELYLALVAKIVSAEVAKTGLDAAIHNQNLIADAETIVEHILRDKIEIL